MFYYDWKSVLAPIALYAYGEHNEKKAKKSKEILKRLLTCAANDDRSAFESLLLLTNADINESEKMWKIAHHAARELVEYDKNKNADVSYLAAFKGICDRIV